jgi:hypothetical protein
MIKKPLKIIFKVAITIAISCNTKINKQESPLAIVVKLISAESFADFTEASKYIDVQEVYANDRDSLTAIQAWKKEILFYYGLNQDKKFTNAFKYYNYNIKEKQGSEYAEISFEAKNSGSNVQKITYTLKNNKGQWIVVKIDYLHK